jgi:AraC-like DNA-binding protein
MAYILRAVALTFSDGHQMEAHAHPWGQLIYAATGTMRVLAADALWIVPQGRALWAPPNVAHEIQMRGSVAMRTIYVPPERSEDLPSRCRALEVGALLRELILHIVSLRLLSASDSQHVHLAEVFLDRLAKAERVMLHVPMPSSARFAQLSRQLREDSAVDISVPLFARRIGVSTRTLQRLFREETGMRFVEWRQRLKLIHAIARLSTGATVTEAGADAGYANTSAFIAAFRAHMGETPKAFQQARS